MTDIKGYVTAKYDGQWWLGCVMKTHPETDEVEVNFLHPHGSAKSFYYPQHSDILIMSCQDILTTVDPTTSTGRAYRLTTEEMNAATDQLKTDFQSNQQPS